MDIAFTVALNAMTLISILMLVGLGLGIIYGLMGVINLSHGEFVTIGAFTLALVQGFGGSFWLALLIAPIVGGLIGLLIEQSIIRHLYTRPLATIMATWGLSLIIQQSLQLVFGASPQKVFSPISSTVSLFGANYPVYRLVLIALAISLMVSCHLLLKKTRFGLDLRTVIQNPDMADALGINTKRVYAIAFSLGAGFAAIAGVLIAPLTAVVAHMGVNYLARSFFVVIVGGAGSVPGVVAGSTFVGGIETLLNYVIPATISQALVLVFAIILVRMRPTGLVRV
ncbi:urea ABC transporter permease subunit UrtB [uncultured Ruegeria sp.]|uniref:urea ABC transporter permease subunit UrtB n=1 Tax=uncultured Ruegeria sp. TaxID=259304 RepID=UPI0026294891|nr:urea ABC transporter permease subunit UrtB [uncultured Ruegeria sp.]